MLLSILLYHMYVLRVANEWLVLVSLLLLIRRSHPLSQKQGGMEAEVLGWVWFEAWCQPSRFVRISNLPACPVWRLHSRLLQKRSAELCLGLCHFQQKKRFRWETAASGGLVFQMDLLGISSYHPRVSHSFSWVYAEVGLPSFSLSPLSSEAALQLATAVPFSFQLPVGSYSQHGPTSC